MEYNFHFGPSALQSVNVQLVNLKIDSKQVIFVTSNQGCIRKIIVLAMGFLLIFLSTFFSKKKCALKRRTKGDVT